MGKTRESMKSWILEVAKGFDHDFMVEHRAGEDILSYCFPLECELKEVKVKIFVADKISVVATPSMAIPMDVLDRVGELLMRLNFQTTGNFYLNYDTGALNYILDVRFEDCEKADDVAFLWLMPLATLEICGKALMRVLRGEISPRDAVKE